MDFIKTPDKNKIKVYVPIAQKGFQGNRFAKYEPIEKGGSAKAI
jgi:hypothetical protein